MTDVFKCNPSLTRGLLPDGPLIAAVGETVNFTTTLTPPANPFLSVAWKFGLKDIITSGVNFTPPEYEGRITLFMSTGSLELRNVSLSDTGEYRVFILPQGETLKEGSTRLAVYVPVSNVTATASSTDMVEFNSSPVSNVVISVNETNLVEMNGSAVLKCSVSSSGSSLSFLWMNGSSEVTASDRVQLTDGNSTLTIVNVTRYDQGPFRCHVFNPVSNGTSDPVKLSISYGPESTNLTTSPSREYYVEGSNISLSCSADSRPVPHFYWLLNGVKLSHTGAEFRLMNIHRNQSGNYSCQAFNNKTLRNEASQPSAVSVLVRVANVVVTSSPTDLVEFSSSVRLSCSSSGSLLSFLWLNGSSVVTESDRVQLTDGNSTLTIVNVTRNDQGFMCRVSNPVSTGTSDPVNLSISYGPEYINLTLAPSQRYYKEGSNITLMCTAVSKPSAMFYWFLNGNLLSDTGPELRLMNIKMNHSGYYSCQAFNNKTLRNQTSQPSVVSVLEKISSASVTPSANLVIEGNSVNLTCDAAGSVFTREWMKDGSALILAENIKLDNESRELNYADISFFQSKDGGRVQIGLQNETSEYAQVCMNNSPPAASSPPTYDAHLQRMKRQAPQPGANGTHTYA
ncbi:cell adhesion molecule CEACAM5-like [Symphorus nematophorus]